MITNVNEWKKFTQSSEFSKAFDKWKINEGLKKQADLYTIIEFFSLKKEVEDLIKELIKILNKKGNYGVFREFSDTNDVPDLYRDSILSIAQYTILKRNNKLDKLFYG